MKIAFFSSAQPNQSALQTLQQLRPQYTEQALLEQINVQLSRGYQLVYVTDQTKVLAVAGFYIGYKLAWGKHLYVDDLVTNQEARSTGVGKYLLDWLKDYAKEHECCQLHLDSGVQRFAAHKFYLREGFKIASHHFSYELPDNSAKR